MATIIILDRDNIKCELKNGERINFGVKLSNSIFEAEFD